MTISKHILIFLNSKETKKKHWSDSTNWDTIDYNQVLKFIRNAINTTSTATLTLG
jgi:hypothetical protein